MQLIYLHKYTVAKCEWEKNKNKGVQPVLTVLNNQSAHMTCNNENKEENRKGTSNDTSIAEHYDNKTVV